MRFSSKGRDFTREDKSRKGTYLDARFCISIVLRGRGLHLDLGISATDKTMAHSASMERRTNVIQWRENKGVIRLLT